MTPCTSKLGSPHLLRLTETQGTTVGSEVGDSVIGTANLKSSSGEPEDPQGSRQLDHIPNRRSLRHLCPLH